MSLQKTLEDLQIEHGDIESKLRKLGEYEATIELKNRKIFEYEKMFEKLQKQYERDQV